MERCEREDPPVAAAEKPILEAYLDWQGATRFANSMV